VELGIVARASDSTIGRTLKKTVSNPITGSAGHPPKGNSAFVAATEDVLAVYTRPHDPDRPLVCLDETSKQLRAISKRLRADPRSYRRRVREAGARAWPISPHNRMPRAGPGKAVGAFQAPGQLPSTMSNRNCFELLVKMIAASAITRGRKPTHDLPRDIFR
jgi:hypothetical protein